MFWRVFDGFDFFLSRTRDVLSASIGARVSTGRRRRRRGGRDEERERKTVDDDTAAAGKIARFVVARQSKAIFFSSFGGRDKA